MSRDVGSSTSVWELKYRLPTAKKCERDISFAVNGPHKSRHHRQTDARHQLQHAHTLKDDSIRLIINLPVPSRFCFLCLSSFKKQASRMVTWLAIKETSYALHRLRVLFLSIYPLHSLFEKKRRARIVNGVVPSPTGVWALQTYSLLCCSPSKFH
ncbi:hypothetical protein HNY73_013792 [Argiope bruennichi]|uniref:Uncharacterized protein n=1 Tax=Argiope bruennichi TaxID=94029 RepID=A0A8T0ES58_ARGBR|nr:hypothetical protein HNY73_013792 [Argiope bruennichi]